MEIKLTILMTRNLSLLLTELRRTRSQMSPKPNLRLKLKASRRNNHKSKLAMGKANPPLLNLRRARKIFPQPGNRIGKKNLFWQVCERRPKSLQIANQIPQSRRASRETSKPATRRKKGRLTRPRPALLKAVKIFMAARIRLARCRIAR